MTAKDVWLSCGGYVTHHFNGACEYKLGCVAADMEDYALAMYVINQCYYVLAYVASLGGQLII